MKIENESSFRAAFHNGANLFLGSGFSVLSRNIQDSPIPTGAMLADELVTEFDLPALRGSDLSMISQVIKSARRQEFNEYLKRRFTVGSFDPRYLCLERLNVKRIFTTNIDDLPHHIYQSSETKYLNDTFLRGQLFGDRSGIEYLPLHGSVSYPDADFTFTPIEISAAFSNNPSQFEYLVTALDSSDTIFLGYSLRDASTLQSLYHSLSKGQQSKGRWIQLHGSDAAAESYFKSLGFSIIHGDTNEVLTYLCLLSEEDKRSTKKTRTALPTGKIPKLADVPVRPITDYYRGHAPTWYEVLAGRLPTLSIYRRLLDQIDSGKNVLIKAIPVSGKSTLLMQAAANYFTNKQKVFEEYVTIDKARMIVSHLGDGDEILMFIDNAGDSVDALDLLTSDPRIQVIGADRSVNIGFGSHRFNIKKFEVLDCSDLASTDYQSIYDAIPANLRNARMRIPEIESGNNASVFEFIEANVQGQQIADRYHAVLAQLLVNDKALHDLFVMICYVFSCHAPVSFDVISRFAGANGNYQLVYNRVESLGRLLAEMSDEQMSVMQFDSNQDHYTPRSQVIAATVVEACKNEDFSRIYQTFHSRVPRLFIPRFSVFRRFGYRSHFVDRAFADWKEGMKFYEKAYSEDRTYFLKQQMAIFLGARKQFSLAFKFIDEALAESRGKNPNVRHTHARLLFEANIDKAPANPSLRDHLRESMRILESCHEYDQRQTNHALRFADQSVRYRAVFPGQEANEYCEKASRWLDEELQRQPSLRHARYLLKKLKS